MVTAKPLPLKRRHLLAVAGFAFSQLLQPLMLAALQDWQAVKNIEALSIWAGALIGDYLDYGRPTLRASLIFPALGFALGSFLEAFIPGIPPLTSTTTLSSGLALIMYEAIKQPPASKAPSPTPN
jgi:hypothetical protein